MNMTLSYFLNINQTKKKTKKKTNTKISIMYNQQVLKETKANTSRSDFKTMLQI